ncbi:hypothetical protein IAQ61_004219 [Plenodomus lingam]|uniref:uncharacterized protein n=1 Tax=Leptosphaeria maculans TaxID=5022 RepID=UPI003331567D|nr:hypothetical protein IAQ61_004219 [Plenodomus lingam]
MKTGVDRWGGQGMLKLESRGWMCRQWDDWMARAAPGVDPLMVCMTCQRLYTLPPQAMPVQVLSATEPPLISLGDQIIIERTATRSTVDLASER